MRALVMAGLSAALSAPWGTPLGATLGAPLYAQLGASPGGMSENQIVWVSVLLALFLLCFLLPVVTIGLSLRVLSQRRELRRRIDELEAALASEGGKSS